MYAYLPQEGRERTAEPKDASSPNIWKEEESGLNNASSPTCRREESWT